MVDSINCPKPEILSAFIDGRMEGEARDCVVSHLDECEDCYEIFTESIRFLKDGERGQIVSPKRFQWKGVAFKVASIAAAVLLMVFGWRFFRDPLDGPWTDREWWLQEYREADRQDPLVQEARKILGRMITVADIRAGIPRLDVFEIESDPVAATLADGTVILSRKGLELCYRDGISDASNARMAWVLGHELAHLHSNSNDDRLYGAFAASRKTSDDRLRVVDDLRTVDNLYERELRADRMGLVYATQAGFDPWEIAEQSRDFLREWTNQITEEAAYQSHPDPETRADFLRRELLEIANELDYFQFGVLAFQAGRLDLAQALLDQFKDRFPSREVFANLGLVHYQLAMRELSRCDGRQVLRFKLPVVLDTITLAERTRLRGTADSSCLESDEFVAQAEKAFSYFDQARTRGAEYLPAELNTFSLRLASHDFDGALLLAHEISDRFPGDLKARMALALATYAFAADKGAGGHTLVEEAVRTMQSLLAEVPEDVALLFNLASMLSEQRRIEEAEVLWNRYLKLEPAGEYSEYVRERLRRPQASRVEATEPVSPIPLGTVSEETRARLAVMTSKPLPLDGISGLRVFRDQDQQYLEQDSSIEIAAVETDISPGEVLDLYGPPHGRLATPAGEILLYRSFAFETRQQRVVRRVHFRIGRR